MEWKKEDCVMFDETCRGSVRITDEGEGYITTLCEKHAAEEYKIPEKVFDRNWFDIVKFDFREYGGDVVGVHAWKVGHNCIRIKVSKSIFFDNINIFKLLHEEAERVWSEDHVKQVTCPTCGSQLRLCLRYWKGRPFCAVCAGDLTGIAPKEGIVK